MGKITKQSLLHSENLTLPSVIVLTANMNCPQCQEKVSQIISKITGLKEFTVDVPNKQVTVKADSTLHKNVKDDYTTSCIKFTRLCSSSSCFRNLSDDQA